MINQPSSTQGFSDYHDDNNFIGAGVDNQIINSQRCSILQGSSNFISGKYNCHAIGDYMGTDFITFQAGEYIELQDNSFNIGCYNGTYSWGPMFTKRGLSVTHDAVFDREVRIGSTRNRNLQPAGFYPNDSWITGATGPNGEHYFGNEVGYLDFDAQLDSNTMTARWGARIHNGFIVHDKPLGEPDAIVLRDQTSDIFITSDPNKTDKISNLNVEGDVVAFGSSDERLKDNISLIKDPLGKVLLLDAIEFDWNSKQQAYRGHDLGLIAQQVEAVAPELVITRCDGYKAIKYEKINSLVVGAIKQQQEIIDSMKEELKELKDKINHS